VVQTAGNLVRGSGSTDLVNGGHRLRAVRGKERPWLRQRRAVPPALSRRPPVDARIRCARNQRPTTSARSAKSQGGELRAAGK